MPHRSKQWYVSHRQAYHYDAPDCRFTILQTGSLSEIGTFEGIFSCTPETPGITLGRFEKIVKEVFNDCLSSYQLNANTDDHIENLRSISTAIAHWKNASQGGRGQLRGDDVRNRFDKSTFISLMRKCDPSNLKLKDFMIGGMGVPTASAFLRFLSPDKFGTVDRWVVEKHTNKAQITDFKMSNNGHIYATKANSLEYQTSYVNFLREEADWLNAQGATYLDLTSDGPQSFRACDVEMALFVCHSLG